MIQLFLLRNKIFLGVVLLMATTTYGAVKLPNVLSSNMVLQRGQQTSIWGSANPGETVTVTFRGEKVKEKASKEGAWLVKLAAGDAGGPFEMTIKAENTIVLSNILVGDVWVCSGQSNMEWPLFQTEKGPADVLNAKYPTLRFFTVQKNTSKEPLDDTMRARWEQCNPETAKNFSAVGFYFGRKVNLETGVPIGLISSNWGGTNVETWMSEEAALTDEIMAEGVSKLKLVNVDSISKSQQAIFETYKKALKEVQRLDFTREYLYGNFDDSQWTSFNQPQLWENIDGFSNFNGIVWYRKAFEIPANFNLTKATVSLCKVDDTDITWINGKRVGETYNQYSVPRKYDLGKDVLKIGKNQLVMRIEDYSGGGGIYGDASEMVLTDGTITVDLSGDWKVKKDETPTPQNVTNPAAAALQPNEYPTLLFNGMIHPLLNYAIKGAIWYQGESNANSIQQAIRYENQLRTMIADWRKHWGVGSFPFYMVQLANYKAETMVPVDQAWPYLRETQAKLANEEKVGMACIIDIGNADDIHPRNKVDVGERLALNALKFDYNKELTYCGPRKNEVAINGNKALVTFDFVGNGLVLKNKYGYINGFAVAGADKVFHYAKAGLVAENQVEVTSDKVNEIVAVRFLWADNPGSINLYNSANLPAEPFRTDSW